MSNELIRPGHEPRALTVPEPKHDLHPVRTVTPPAGEPPPAVTTYGPHDRVPQADAEPEC